MKLDELALANQQLADMLKSGMPLEGALREVCQGCATGRLREELGALEHQLAGGKPFAETIAQCRLPELFRQTLLAGAQSNALPMGLNALADHYAGMHAAWERLRTVLVYPALVLLAATGVSLLTSIITTEALETIQPEFFDLMGYSGGLGVREPQPNRFLFKVWTPPVVLCVLIVVGAGLLRSPHVRRELEWVLPAFKEHKLAAFASSMSVLVRAGVPLAEALRLIGAAGPEDRLGHEIKGWLSRLEAGERDFEAATRSTRLLPPLFRWAVTSTGADLAAGFRKAADLFERRASYFMELLLNAALPVLVLVLAGTIVLQALPLMNGLIIVMDRLGS